MRIRVFGSSRFETPVVGVHQSALLALSAYRPVKTLLPNLHTFSPTSHPVIYTIPFSQTFLGPNLHTMHISDCDKAGVDPLCISALRLSPNIKRITLVMDGPIPKSFYRLIHTVKTLTHIIFPCLPTPLETIECLSHHPNLRQLWSVNIPKSNVHHFTTEAGRFPSLEDFCFSVPNWSSAAALMCQMQCRFTKLVILPINQGGEVLSSILDLTSCISQHPSQLSLTNLIFCTVYSTALGDDVDGAAISSAFEPLFNCTGLREFQVTSSVVAKLDDAWLMKASFAWPSLQRLILKNFYPEPSEITLSGLVPLVKHCPDLVTLIVGLHASPISTHLLKGVYNLELHDLMLGPSTIKSPGQVVRSLIRLFPSLEQVAFDSTTAVHTEAWMTVNKILRSMTHE